jgi:hypothetical protein
MRPLTTSIFGSSNSNPPDKSKHLPDKGSQPSGEIHNYKKDTRDGVSSCTPDRTCSEPHPSLKLGENTVQMNYLFTNLIETLKIVK